MAANDALSTAPNQPIDVYVLGNDTDPNGDRLSVAAVTRPADGSVTIFNGPLSSEPQYVRSTPPTAFAGNATFTYTVTDGTRTATATVTVDPAPPAAQPDAVTTGLTCRSASTCREMTATPTATASS